MIIEKLNVNNFGKLREQSYELQPGINVIYGRNEAGKSTLHTFIRSMFFGVSRLRGKGARTDGYSRNEPWENPAYYGGSIEFQCGGKSFRLERDFYRETPRTHLVSLQDGEHLDPAQGDLKMLLGGINERVYDNTVSVGQLKSATGRELAEELRSYMANYQGAGDEKLDPSGALQILKEQRRKLQQKQKEAATEQELLLREIRGKLQLVEMQISDCEKKLMDLGRISAQSQRHLSEEETYVSSSALGEEKKESFHRIWRGIALSWAVVAAAALILAVLSGEGDMAVICFILAAVAGIQLPISLLIHRWLLARLPAVQPEKKEAKEGGLELPPEGQVRQKETLERIHWNIRQMEEEQQERRLLLENLQQEAEELSDEMYEKGWLGEELEGVELAIEILEETARSMQKRIGSRITCRTGEILCELTEGQYKRILMNSEMEVHIQTTKRELKLHQVSRGTLEQIYFSLRMAVSEVLCAGESMPVLLDEVFSMYDEGRLLQALSWLEKHSEQTVIFTCHRREEHLLKKNKIPYHLIVM